LTHFIYGDAVSMGAFALRQTVALFYTSFGTSGTNFGIEVQGDQSVVVRDQPQVGGTIYCQSAPNVIPQSGYYYLELKAIIDAVSGLFQLRVNGNVVCTFIGDNVIAPFPADVQYLRLMGGGSGIVTFHDDLYILDTSTPPNNDYLAPANSTQGVPIECFMPAANGGLIQWAPLANQNWQEVNEIPPDDDLSYNADGTVGQIDNYIFQPNIPVGTQLFGAQVNLDARMDNPAGSRGIQPNFNGVGQPAFAELLTIDYQIFSSQYDINPHTGVAFVPGDFPATEIGPEVSA
jgi:hypothetical protein